MRKLRAGISAAILIILSALAAYVLNGAPYYSTNSSGEYYSFPLPSEAESFDYSDIEEYSGEPYIEVNGDIPFFISKDITTEAFESYSELDGLGRCGAAVSCIGKELMPTEDRGPIGMIKPTGWHTVRYSGIDGNYLYNRCHLIGFQLTGENANDKNLITGTRYMNIQGMLPIENDTASYVRKTNNHVLYRATPVFIGDELLCRGVLLEGYSVEDSGCGLCFCRFVYNVQPGVSINYSDGSSDGPLFDEGR